MQPISKSYPTIPVLHLITTIHIFYRKITTMYVKGGIGKCMYGMGMLMATVMFLQTSLRKLQKQL